MDPPRTFSKSSIVAQIVVVWARDEDVNVGGFTVDRSDGEIDAYEASVITGKPSNRALWQAQI